MIRFIILFISLGCSYSFAETNYRKEIENFAQSLVFAKYEASRDQESDEKLYTKVSALDKRLTYKLCKADLTGDIVANKLKKNTSVKVTCPDPDGWDIYVRIKVQLLYPSIITRNTLRKGETLNTENIKRVYLDKSKLRSGSFTDTNLLFGTRLKRNISANKIVKNKDICFVCKDDKVTIHAFKNGLSIKASGIALSDANIGSTVRVKNSRTQRIIVGTVSALKEVQVSF